MLSNFSWVPVGEGFYAGGLRVSTFHITGSEPNGWAPAFAYDLSLPVAQGIPEPLKNGQDPLACRLWTQSQRGSFLVFLDKKLPPRPDNQLTAAFCQTYFANIELRLLLGDNDQRLLDVLAEFLQRQPATFLRTGLSQKFNQLAQLVGHRQGPGQHIQVNSWLRSLPGVSWTKLEVNMLLTAFVNGGVAVDAGAAILAAWADCTPEEQARASAIWSVMLEKFGREFSGIYPDGLVLIRPSATVPFIYDPTHPDVSHPLGSRVNLGFEKCDFFADGQLSEIRRLFRSLLSDGHNGLVTAGLPGTQPPDKPAGVEVGPEAQQRHGFEEVVVRPGKPISRAQDLAGLNPKHQSHNAADQARLEAAQEQDGRIRILLDGVLARGQTGKGVDGNGEPANTPESSVPTKLDPGMLASLRLALKGGNIPADLAPLVHVGEEETLVPLLQNVECIVNRGSAFCILTGHNGSGKTHYLDLEEQIGVARGLVVVRGEIEPDCRLHGKHGEVRKLITKLMSSLRFKGSSEGKGLRGLLETIRAKFTGSESGEVKALTEAVSTGCEPLLDHAGGAEMAEMVVKYCLASTTGETVLASKILAWFRAEYGTPAEVKKAFGVTSLIGDADLMRHLKLVTILAQIAGKSGVLVLIDELSVLTRNLHGPVRAANQDVVLNILNDALGGRLQGLGFIFAGTHDCLDARQRGLLASEALKSRLQRSQNSNDSASGLIVEVRRLITEQFFIVLQKVRCLRLSEPSMADRLPDGALHALLAKAKAPLGAEEGLVPRELLKAFEQLVLAMEVNPTMDWADALGSSAAGGKPSEEETASKAKTSSLRNLKL
jgi:hypothetical protein